MGMRQRKGANPARSGKPPRLPSGSSNSGTSATAHVRQLKECIFSAPWDDLCNPAQVSRGEYPRKPGCARRSNRPPCLLCGNRIRFGRQRRRYFTDRLDECTDRWLIEMQTAPPSPEAVYAKRSLRLTPARGRGLAMPRFSVAKRPVGERRPYAPLHRWLRT